MRRGFRRRCSLGHGLGLSLNLNLNLNLGLGLNLGVLHLNLGLFLRLPLVASALSRGFLVLLLLLHPKLQLDPPQRVEVPLPELLARHHQRHDPRLQLRHERVALEHAFDLGGDGGRVDVEPRGPPFESREVLRLVAVRRGVPLHRRDALLQRRRASRRRLWVLVLVLAVVWRLIFGFGGSIAREPRRQTPAGDRRAARPEPHPRREPPRVAIPIASVASVVLRGEFFLQVVKKPLGRAEHLDAKLLNLVPDVVERVDRVVEGVDDVRVEPRGAPVAVRVVVIQP